jgi:ubiquinone/menaquinone biosynthesis C-methylase UbiE
MKNTEKSYYAHQHEYEKNHREKQDMLRTLRQIHEPSDDKTASEENQKYKQFAPLLDRESVWLTIGDHYGEEAHWISSCGKEVVAADINIDFLQLAHQEGYITKWSHQNAEKMTFEDDSFDCVLCRESYHHFPRPYIAVYEMLRCAKKAVVISEPLDPLSKTPLLLTLCNLLDTKRNPVRSAGIWKNRFSFETAGNYVYKVSPREFEKLAMGIGLPAIAFHYSGFSYYLSTRKNRIALWMLKLFSKTGLDMNQLLTTILFKELPDEATVRLLRKAGYYYYKLPENPYL